MSRIPLTQADIAEPLTRPEPHSWEVTLYTGPDGKLVATERVANDITLWWTRPNLWSNELETT